MAAEDRLPAFLLKRLEESFSPEERDRILAGYGCSGRSAFRVNPLRGTKEEVLSELKEKGIPFEPLPWYEDGYVSSAGADREIRQTAAYENGALYLQNPSSMLPPVLLGDCAGKDVLDMCAAPGGKTTQIAAMAGGKCGIMACEKDKNRAERLKYNLEKQGARAAVQVCDARKLDSFFRFDRILLDAPCSGTGTVLLDRENTYSSFSELLVKNSAKLQYQLLKKAFSMLKKDGVLVYSTCSLLPEEDEEVVKRLLETEDAVTAPLPESLSALPRLSCGTENGIKVCPDEVHEGFFAVKIMRKC